MRVLVIGCGSIGSRRARLLAEMGHAVTGIDIADSLADALTAGPAAAFVCTPADTHYEIASACAAAGVPTFIEKPLCASWADLARFSALPLRSDRQVNVACNMRYAYNGFPASSMLHLESSQPLKDWRPGAEVTYRAHGIVLESAIHELDLIRYWLGPIARAEIVGTADRVLIGTTHRDGGTASIRCDWGENAEGERFVLSIGYGRTLWPDTSDQMYRREMVDWLDAVKRDSMPVNSLARALEVTAWALRLRDQLEVAI